MKEEKKYPEEFKKQIDELYKNGKTVINLAREYGLVDQNKKNLLEEFNSKCISVNLKKNAISNNEDIDNHSNNCLHKNDGGTGVGEEADLRWSEKFNKTRENERRHPLKQ